MKITDELRLNIHMYAILDLAIKSLQHDQKLFESFKISRPYITMCKKQLEVLNDELRVISRQLYRAGARYEGYQCISKTECVYSFLYRGQTIPFHYNGNLLLEQVERKIKLNLQSSSMLSTDIDNDENRGF